MRCPKCGRFANYKISRVSKDDIDEISRSQLRLEAGFVLSCSVCNEELGEWHIDCDLRCPHYDDCSCDDETYEEEFDAQIYDLNIESWDLRRVEGGYVVEVHASGYCMGCHTRFGINEEFDVSEMEIDEAIL